MALCCAIRDSGQPVIFCRVWGILLLYREPGFVQRWTFSVGRGSSTALVQRVYHNSEFLTQSQVMNHRSTHTRKDNDRLLTSTRFLEKAKNREMMASIKGKTMATSQPQLVSQRMQKQRNDGIFQSYCFGELGSYPR